MSRAALLVAVEGVALVVLGVGYGVAGVLVVLVARGLSRVQGWARAPAVVVQLLALPVGVGLVQGRVWYAAVPVLALAGSVLYCLATPEARLAFRGLD